VTRLLGTERTAYVGQHWDTYDVAPWNLYNVLWCAQQWMRRWLG